MVPPYTRRIRLELTDGRVLTGRPNYGTATHIEIRLSNGQFAWIERATIARWTSA